MLKRILSIIIICILLSPNLIYATTNNDYIKSYTEDINDLKSNLEKGEVEVRKSVKYNGNGEFDISLLSQSNSYETKRVTDKIYNIVFAIDNSASMYGTSGRIQACVNSINTVIRNLAPYKNINIAVIAYSSGAKLDYSQDGAKDLYNSYNTEKASTLLPLAHYDSSTYIGYTDNYGDGSGKEHVKRNLYRWIYSSIGKKQYAGSTNTQAGFVKSYEILNNATNKDIATPIIILMSDGEATDYAYVSDPFSDYKYEISTMQELENYKAASTDFFTSNHLASICAILNANYVKTLLNKTYKNQSLIYSLGYSLSREHPTYNYCLSTLNPIPANINLLKNYMNSGYEQYGLYSLVNSSNFVKQFKEKYNLKNLEYSDGYYEGNTNNIKEIYRKIVNDVIIEQVDTNPLKEKTYLTITDTIGKEFNLIKTAESIKMKIKINEENEREIELKKDENNNFRYNDENIEVNYTDENSQVIFKIKSNYITNKKINLTYAVKLNDKTLKKADGTTYYTNDVKNTKYSFEPNIGNPKYSEQKVEKNLDITGSITLKIASNVIVKYQDEEGNILDQGEINGYVGDSYETETKEFTGYDLKKVPDNAQGTMVRDTTYVTYIYSKVYGTVTIEKVDKKDNSIKLENVEFCIYDSNNEEKYKVYTDVNGIAKFTNLEVGKYTIVETNTIEGYSLLKDKIQVEINKNNRDVKLQLQNEKKTELPFAGGQSKLPLIIIGIIIVCIATYIRYKFIKNKEEGIE